MKKFGFALAVLLLASPAFAQETLTDEEFGATITVPTGWETVAEDDRSAFNFKHEDHSQIEVIGNELMTADVSDVFFTHFHDTLQSSDFQQVGREDKSYGDYTGTETIYRFEHSGVALKVAVFEFVRESTIWLAVGYMQEEVFDTHAEEFRGVVSSLAFGE